MYRAPGELPQKPGIHGAEQQSPLLGQTAGRGHIVQHPANLGGGKIAVDQKTGFVPYRVFQSLFFQLAAEIRRAAALPYNGDVYKRQPYSMWLKWTWKWRIRSFPSWEIKYSSSFI